MLTTTTSVTEMKAAFPTPPSHLAVISTPNFHDLVEVLIYIARCAQTHKSTISPNMNLLYVAVPPSVYTHYTNEPYPAGLYPYPQRPTDAPNFAGTVGGNERENCKIAHAIEMKRYEDVQNMNTALVDVFLSLLPLQARIAYEAFTSHAQMQFSGMSFNGSLKSTGRHKPSIAKGTLTI